MKQRNRNGNKRRKSADTLKVMLIASLVFFGVLAHAEDTEKEKQLVPENLEAILQQFNQENGLQPAELADASEDDYGIATYDKSRTQFDGVTNEMQVSYLKLTLDQGVEIPVITSGIRDENIDFSIMMWFKVDQAFNTKSVPGGLNPQIMYLFSFEDSVACFFTDTLTLMCDSWDRRKLQIPANLITPGIWYHLTLSSSAKGESFLLLQDSDHKVVGEDSVQNFGFRQNVMYGWKACLGDCHADFGFFGGIREVLLLQKSVTRDEAYRVKNIILTYDSSVKAYFRFQDIHNKFEKDEFVDWPWLSFKNMPSRREQFVGSDIIPNDVCPSLFHQINTLRWSDENKMEDFSLSESVISQNQYEYTMSVTLQLNETACNTQDTAKAARDCNLIEMEGVFMLYLAGRNTARFFFFASKNYYESASEMFFVPYDQWITIQLTLKHYEGYSIVAADQNGNAFYRTKVAGDMKEQWPTSKLSLFRALDGYVEHFYLTNTQKTLHPYYATDFRDDRDALINVRLHSDEFYDNGFTNIGKFGGRLKVNGEKSFEDVFFQVPSEGNNVVGTLADTNQVFDGIACNDRHMTTHLDTQNSFIRFYTPPFQEWSRENTIEFWFKITDPAVYDQDVLLFSMISSQNNPQLYYHVYIENGDLKCAPFGASFYKDPILTFTQFRYENEDTYGWWHISCSYKFQETSKGILFNTIIAQSLEETMEALPKFYPTNSLIASFGAQDSNNSNMSTLSGASNVLIKEFRYWNVQLTSGDLSNNRYRQIDPTKLDGETLIVYLRLATGSSLIDNFAARNDFYTFDGFNIQQNGLSFVEDFIETEKYSYDQELDLVVSQKSRTYHTVCPVHTYYMKQYCYSEPVNKAILAIFPQWNEQSQSLGWEMTLVHSSVINREVMKFLKDSWSSTDSILNDYITEQSTSKMFKQVPSTVLRHESEYQLQASLTNDELTFLKKSDVRFSPSKCKWFTIVDKGVSEGYDIFQVSPGTDDIIFTLELKRNPELDCGKFDFFDAFSGLDFEFLMTDTADYISYIPKMTTRISDGVSDAVIGFGDKATDTMFVDITLSKKEQEKLPVFSDIMILLTVHWSSSSYGHSFLTEDIVFQNLLYTIKFEPIANVLFADLVASQSDVIRDETLILDASSSKISNMPEVQQKRSLAFQWVCPAELDTYCRTIAGAQLAIPFSQVKKSGIVFEKEYEFTVTVIWAKPDGEDEKSTLSVTAKWYDLIMPEFNIEFDPSQTMITAKQNSLFYLQAENFDADNISDYEVEWTINPELEDPQNLSILSSGKVMQILKGSYSKNTSYVVTLSVQHKALEKLKAVKTVEFETLAPPVGGNISVQPFEGFVGDEFSVILTDWTSANMPIEYNVYSTLDANGIRQGSLLNEEGPILSTEEFKFIAERTTPIIVQVFDASGEVLEYTLKPQISLPPEPEPEDDTNTDGGTTDPESNEDSTNADGDSTADGSSEENGGEDVAPADGARRSLHKNIEQIQNSKNFSTRVNFMNIAIETIQSVDDSTSGTQSSSGFSKEEHIEFRKELIVEIEKNVIQFQNEGGQSDSVVSDDPLRISPRDFITESFQMIAQLTSSPHYLDQDIVDKCVQVVYLLQTMKDNLFDLVLEANDGDLRATFLRTLENLNLYARMNTKESTLKGIRAQFEQTMDKMCNYVGLPEVYSYNSSVEELGFSLFKFDRQKALLGKRGTLHALDATYNYSAYTMYNWFTAIQPGELCLKVYAQQFGTVDMDGAYIGNSKARLQVSIHEIGSNLDYQMGELSGQTVATFAIDRSNFVQNQTICMGYSKSDSKWKSELCQSELKVQEVSMKCTCNAFSSNLIGVFNDYSREVGEPVQFPAIEIKDNVMVISTEIDPSLAVSTQKGTLSGAKDQLDGTNYVWMGQTILVFLLTLAGSIVTYKIDKKDETSENSISRTSPIAAAKQNHFIDEIAKELNEPYAQVALRKQSLFHYRSIFSKSSFPHLMSQLHPLFSPFTSFNAVQSRFMRFILYMLQVNLVATVVYLYYSFVYRQNDPDQKYDMIDHFDISSLMIATTICSILLTPWLSEPLIRACSNQVVASSSPNTENIVQPVQIKTRCRGLRITLITCSILLSVILPIWAIMASQSVPASNQYCMATAVIGSILGATLGSNLLYLWINSCLARKAAYAPTKGKAATSHCLVHYKAVQIVRDMKVVNEIKEQFTLADVLPSSLECSEREVCSIHSNSNASRNISNSNDAGAKKPMQVERTIDEDNQNHGGIVELIEDEADNNSHHKVIDIMHHSEQEEEVQEESKELQTDQNDDSQRGLKPSTMNQVKQPSANVNTYDLNNESQKHLLMGMLNKSGLISNAGDLDCSRNDVVPQRTFIDEPFASIHPEGESNCIQSSLSSSQSSQEIHQEHYGNEMNQQKRFSYSKNENLGQEEDNEASPITINQNQQRQQQNKIILQQ